MRSKKWILLLVVFLVAGCQMFTAAPTPTIGVPSPENTTPPQPTSTPGKIITARPVSEPVDFSTISWQEHTMIPLTVFDPAEVANQQTKLPLLLSSIQNRGVISNLTVDQQVFLAQNRVLTR